MHIVSSGISQLDKLKVVKSKLAMGLLLDVTKVFDRLSHSRQVNKGQTFCIASPLRAWLASQSSTRNKVVKINSIQQR